MQYSDSEQIKVGDRVVLDGGDTGTVVICLDTSTTLGDYNISDWAYLKSGVMVYTDGGAFVRVANPVNSRNSLMIDKLEKRTGDLPE